MALKALVFVTDGSGRGAFAANPSGYGLARVLAASTAESFSIPAGAKFVSFACTVTNFWATFDGTTAAVPAADITNGSAPELNPGMRQLTEGQTTISVIAAEDCIVNALFWS